MARLCLALVLTLFVSGAHLTAPRLPQFYPLPEIRPQWLQWEPTYTEQMSDSADLWTQAGSLKSTHPVHYHKCSGGPPYHSNPNGSDASGSHPPWPWWWYQQQPLIYTVRYVWRNSNLQACDFQNSPHQQLAAGPKRPQGSPASSPHFKETVSQTTPPPDMDSISWILGTPPPIGGHSRPSTAPLQTQTEPPPVSVAEQKPALTTGGVKLVSSSPAIYPQYPDWNTELQWQNPWMPKTPYSPWSNALASSYWDYNLAVKPEVYPAGAYYSPQH